jgi:DNA-directed RNA polymerase I subunit RPA2
MSAPGSSKHTFNTLARESTFKHPPTGSSVFPILNEFVAPHIESFNALFDDSGLPFGDGDGLGLLSLAIKDIGERVVFDGARQSASGESNSGWGNRLSSENLDFCYLSISTENFKFGSSKYLSRDRWSPTEIDVP